MHWVLLVVEESWQHCYKIALFGVLCHRICHSCFLRLHDLSGMKLQYSITNKCDFQVVKAGENITQLQNAAGFNEEFQAENSNYAGRIVISSLMIAAGAVASLFSLFAIFLLSKIIVVTIPVYPLQSVIT